MFKEKYWRCSADQLERALEPIEKLVDASVGEALKEYMKEGFLGFSMEDKGPLKISFVCDDDGKFIFEQKFDELLRELKEYNDTKMVNAFKNAVAKHFGT